MGKTAKFTTKYLDKLIEEATTDAYNESEQAGGFFAMIEENLALPFVTQVLGQEMTSAKIDVTKRDKIVAIAYVARRLKQFQSSICPCPSRGQRGRNGLMLIAVGTGIDGGKLRCARPDRQFLGPCTRRPRGCMLLA